MVVVVTVVCGQRDRNAVRQMAMLGSRSRSSPDNLNPFYSR